MAAGDFVRRCKQIVDLLGQIADAAPQPALAATAHKAGRRRDARRRRRRPARTEAHAAGRRARRPGQSPSPSAASTRLIGEVRPYCDARPDSSTGVGDPRRQGRVVLLHGRVGGHPDHQRRDVQVVRGGLEAGPLGALEQRVAIGQRAAQRGQVAVPVDQRGRGLLADARHPGQPVAGVAAQRREVGVGRPVGCRTCAAATASSTTSRFAHAARRCRGPAPRARRRPAGTGRGRR